MVTRVRGGFAYQREERGCVPEGGVNFFFFFFFLILVLVYVRRGGRWTRSGGGGGGGAAQPEHHQHTQEQVRIFYIQEILYTRNFIEKIIFLDSANVQNCLL